MSAAAAVWRLRRLTRAAAREPVAPAPRRVLISARHTPAASQGRIERLEYPAGRIEVLLRLEDGSSATATLFDDGVNSLELQTGGTTFVLPAPHGQSDDYPSPAAG